MEITDMVEVECPHCKKKSEHEITIDYEPPEEDEY